MKESFETVEYQELEDFLLFVLGTFVHGTANVFFYKGILYLPVAMGGRVPTVHFTRKVPKEIGEYRRIESHLPSQKIDLDNEWRPDPKKRVIVVSHVKKNSIIDRVLFKE